LHPSRRIDPGGGWGLDHVEIAVTDPKTARDMYSTNLGFTLTPAVAERPGVQHFMIGLWPTFIEFLWFGGAGETEPGPYTRRLRGSVDAGGGILQYAIYASPIQGAVDALRMRGLEVRVPQPTVLIVDGKEMAFQFMFATEARNSPPRGDGVVFQEYHAEQPPSENHANTAQRLLPVWVAVPDAAAAERESRRFGFKPLAVRKSSLLGARGREVECGKGTITFWEPSSQNGPLGALLQQKGPGPFGFSVGVASLQKAHQLAEQGAHRKLPLESLGGRKSFVVPKELTGGLWVEFVQQ
jgi:catechol 2,3-dioxygenase-like lactoylglutathione lyase family enzyme